MRGWIPPARGIHVGVTASRDKVHLGAEMLEGLDFRPPRHQGIAGVPVRGKYPSGPRPLGEMMWQRALSRSGGWLAATVLRHVTCSH